AAPISPLSRNSRPRNPSAHGCIGKIFNVSSSSAAAAASSPCEPVGRFVASAAAVDGVNFHPEGAHQPRRRDPDIAEAEDAADAAAQHSVGAALVELAALEVGVLNEQALCRSQR